MVYADTIAVILYWKLDQPYYLHRAHHSWFYEYSSCLSTENYRTPSSLLPQQDSELFPHKLDLMHSLPYEHDLTSTPFPDVTNITY